MNILYDIEIVSSPNNSIWYFKKVGCIYQKCTKDKLQKDHINANKVIFRIPNTFLYVYEEHCKILCYYKVINKYY